MSGNKKHSGKRTPDEILRDARKEVSKILSKARKASAGPPQASRPNQEPRSFSGCIFVVMLCGGIFLGAMTSPRLRDKLTNFAKDLVGQTDVGTNHEVEKIATQGAAPALEAANQRSPNASSVEAYFRMGNELFASRIITNASTPKKAHTPTPGEAPHYGRGSLIGVILRNVRKGERYDITISGDRFIKESSESILIENDALVVNAQPALIYDYEAIRKINQTTSCNLTFKVRRSGELEFKSITATLQLHQINDCPLTMGVRNLQADGTFSHVRSKDFQTITGYVNENHPWIDALLLEARETNICGEFVGYQRGTEQVWPQIDAIWKALENRGLGYSSITTTTTSTHHEFQHVRFLEDSLTNKQSNCLDGSVLLASILRKIGLNVSIMLVPEHAYLIVHDMDNKKFLYAIETIMIGKADLYAAVKMATVDEPFALSKLVNDSKDKYTGDDFRIINIAKMRDAGTQPISFEGAAQPPSIPVIAARDQIGSPAQIVRQQRIILAQKILQKVKTLVDRLDSARGGNPFNLNDPSFQTESYALFSEIRNCQGAFNKLRTTPSLTPIGIALSDQLLSERYSKHIATLRNVTLDTNDQIKKSDILRAADLADALFGIACLPLEY